MSLQRTFNWTPCENPGETFEGWATESHQLSASLRQMLERRISASGGGCWLPTPTAGDAKNARNATSSRQPDSQHHSGTTLCDTVHGTGGKLSPLWVEWLMGWPIGWTDCEPLETDKCRWPQRPLGTT